MATIRHYGPVEHYQCTGCREEFRGAPQAPSTKTWLKSHRKNHIQSRKGMWFWPDDEQD